MSTEVRNKKLYTGPGLYIGRGSPYGNDWTHIPKGTKAIHVVESVKEAVFCFTDWFIYGEDDRAVAYREAMFNRVFENKILICWCVDEHGKGNCHGQVLAAISNQMFATPDRPDYQWTMEYWADKLNNARDKYAPRCSYNDCEVHLF